METRQADFEKALQELQRLDLDDPKAPAVIIHAMIAVPAQFAQEVADLLVASGILSILNYAPINLSVPDPVHVEYIDPVLHLQKMTYYLV